MLKTSNAFFKTTLCAVIFLVSNMSFAGGLELQESSVFVPHNLGSVSLLHDAEGFHAIKNGRAYDVQKCFTDKQLRNVSSEQLREFLKQGYIAVNQMSDGEFSLQAHGRLVGGGPVTASILYWATKSLCYGTAVAAASTAVVATGGAAAGALTTAGVAVATGGAGVGAAAVSGAIAATAGGTALAVEATTGTIVAAGGLAGAVAAVETASMGAFAFGLALPLP